MVSVILMRTALFAHKIAHAPRPKPAWRAPVNYVAMASVRPNKARIAALAPKIVHATAIRARMGSVLPVAMGSVIHKMAKIAKHAKATVAVHKKNFAK
tara:strand:- start:20641 stop:20934 length:294 start_codon:yes stop_codon:yes gene_type:complete